MNAAQPAPSTHARDHDLVVYGATGFVGRLLAAELAEQAPEGARIALAGRSQARLEEVRASLPGAARDWPVVVADSADAQALRRLCESTRVVATTVGPYARYGRELARAAAAAGTHTCDLTGEVLYVRDLVDELDAQARSTGARLVSACGFDSIPSDLGVYHLAATVAADGNGTLGDTTMLVTRLKGGMSGGTIDSMRAQVEEMQRNPERRSIVHDPYALVPGRPRDARQGGQRDSTDVFREASSGRWVAPFVMGPFNTRVVRRTDALLGDAYGPRFRYRELMAFGKGERGRRRATMMRLGLGAVLAGMSSGAVRPLLDRVLPSPGEGPSEEARRAGHFRLELHTTSSSGQRYVGVVAAQGDPGYAATSVMLAQAALCLAFDDLDSPGGVTTPAAAMGDHLLRRLRQRDFTISADRA